MCPDDKVSGVIGAFSGGAMSRREAFAQNVYVLAFLGDSVYSLLARERIVLNCDMKAGAMHSLSVSMVNAAAQAAGYSKIKDMLTEDEEAVFRRARNAHSTHTPKHMTEGDYHCATGVEALFGYLYLSGQKDRMYNLISVIFGDEAEKLSAK